MAEAGLSGFDVNPWYGIFAPAGTPDAVVQRLHREISEILKQDEIRQRFAVLGAEPGAMSQPAFAEFVDQEIAKWAKVVADSGSAID